MQTFNYFLPKISIIIVNYRSSDCLLVCLESLQESLEKHIYCEVIVVNNDEAENPKETCGRFFSVRLINNRSNIGFGSAVNRGAKHARGNFLVILNPDTRVQKGFFSKLLEEFVQNEKMAILGPRLYTSSGHIQEWSTGREVTFWDLLRNNAGIPRSKKVWESSTKREAHWVSGAALAIRKKVFEKLGGFDENFFMYFEDIDLCKRARALGKKVYYCPNISVFHAEGGSRMQKKDRKRIYYASQEYYFEKYYGKMATWLVRVLRILFHK